jgi:hypothetical protein
MKLHLIAAAALLLLTGCITAEIMPIPRTVSEAMQGRRSTFGIGPVADFAEVTAVNTAVGGMVGAAAMIATGNNLIRSNEVQDPAKQVGEMLMKGMAEKYGLKVVPNGMGVLDAEGPRQLSDTFPTCDFVLKVQTMDWSMSPCFTTSPHLKANTPFRLSLLVKASLVDVKTRKVVAEGMVRYVQPVTADLPTHGQLTANNAARLKVEMAKCTEGCYAFLAKNTFGL